MTTDDQAQAGATAEEQTVDDPLDPSNVPDSGATELAEYNEFVDSLEDGEGDESPAVEEQSADAEEDAPEQPEEDEPSEEPDADEEPDAEPEAEAPASEEEDEDEPASRSGRYRIRAKDEVEAEALSLRKRHPEWSLEQCLTKAKSILGVEQSGPSDESEQAQAPSRNVDAVNREIEELRAKHKEATDNLEFSEAGDIFLQIERLRDERDELRISERIQQDKQQQAQIETMERQFQESERKAVTYYPETTDPDSAITMRIIEMDNRMRELGDPLYSSPDKPFILAKKAAAELGIPMSDPKAAKAAAKPAPQPSRPVNPASGNARTIPKPASPKVDEVLAGVDSLEAYEDLAASL